MLSGVNHGIYVSRFSAVELLSPRSYALGGVTRDGTFLIEHGKITRAVRNLRFQDSPVRLLGSIEALGVAERVAVGGGAPLVMPGGVLRDFQFTALSDAV
jgi:predicted Zn-dependent protease